MKNIFAVFHAVPSQVMGYAIFRALEHTSLHRIFSAKAHSTLWSTRNPKLALPRAWEVVVIFEDGHFEAVFKLLHVTLFQVM